MEKQELKDLRIAARTIASDTRRLKKVVNVIRALDDFDGAGNGEFQEAARTELAAVVASLRLNIDRIVNIAGEGASQVKRWSSAVSTSITHGESTSVTYSERHSDVASGVSSDANG
jgi:hypothetical protein